MRPAGWFCIGPMLSVCIAHAENEIEARRLMPPGPDAVSAVIPLYEGDDEEHECVVGHTFTTA